MIKTHIIKEGDKPVAVILDYNEYLKLIELKEEQQDYADAVNTKENCEKWTSHDDVKKMLDI